MQFQKPKDHSAHPIYCTLHVNIEVKHGQLSMETCRYGHQEAQNDYEM